MWVVDPETGEPTPVGEKGELYSRSPDLMDGYLDDAAATDACTTADGFLSSGDVVVRDHEEVLFTHPDVADVAVIGLPDQTWGESVTAAVVPRAGTVLKTTLRDTLGSVDAPLTPSVR